jgi:hypothetical protein
LAFDEGMRVVNIIALALVARWIAFASEKEGVDIGLRDVLKLGCGL